ncbi:MAG: M12 family metallo-peptidase [Thermoproteota archaeon]
MRSFKRVFAVVFLLALFWASAAYSGETKKVLIKPSLPLELMYHADRAVGGDAVTVDTDAVSEIKKDEEVVLDIGYDRFEAVTIDVKADNATGSVVWVGEDRRTFGSGTSIFIISVVEGAVSGYLKTSDGEYNIIPTGIGGEGVLENTANMVPLRDGDPIPISSSKGLKLKKNLPQTEFTLPDTSQTKSFIDILALYSTGLKNYLGGEAGVKAEIQKAVTYANTVFKNSGINAEARVVGYREVALSKEDALEAFSVASGRDSRYPVKQWAESVGADQVTFFLRYIYPSGYCGLGLMPLSLDTYIYNSRSSYPIASSVAVGSHQTSSNVTYFCPVDTFAHELGHNFGCNHDKAHASGSGITSYAYGYCGSGYGTVMSYCHPRIPHFSSDAVIEGKRIGDSTARNAEVVRLTTPYFANIRNSNYNGGGNGGNNGGQEFSISGKVVDFITRGPVSGVNIYAVGNSSGGSAVTGTNGAWTINGLKAETTYKVYASKTGFRFEPDKIDISSPKNDILFYAIPLVGVELASPPAEIYTGSRYTFTWRFLYGNGAPAGWKFTLYTTDSSGKSVVKFVSVSSRSKSQTGSATVYFDPRSYVPGNYTALICVNDPQTPATKSYCDKKTFRVVRK